MADQRILYKIGQRVKNRRKQLEITQTQLSYSCETDPSYIRKIEAGKVNISILNLSKLVKALDTNLSEFLEDL